MRMKPHALALHARPFGLFMRDHWGVISGAIFLALLTGLGVNFLPPGFVMAFSVPLVLYAILLWPSSPSITGEKIIYVYMAYLVVFGVWPQFSSYKVPGLPALEPQRLLYAAVVLSAIACLVIGSEARRQYISTLLSSAKAPALLIGALFATHLALACFAKYPRYSVFLVVREFLTTASIFFAALLFIRSSKDVEKCLKAIVFSALMVSVIALVESIIKKNLFASWVPLSSEYAMWATMERIRDGQYRVQATFDNPLLLVDYLVFVLPVAVYGAIYYKEWMIRLMHISALVLIPLALIRTGSRSAYLALALQMGLVLCVVLLRRVIFARRSYLSFLMLVVVVVLPLLAIPFIGDILSVSGRSAEQAMSTSARVSMLRNAFNSLLNGNIFGVGFGGAPEAAGVVNWAGGSMGYVLDNYFITILMDSGVLALLIFSALAASGLINNFKSAIAIPGRLGMLSASLFVCFTGFLLMKLISSQTQIFPMFYAALVFSIVVYKEARHEQA